MEKEIFLDHEGNADKRKGVGQRIQIHITKIINRGHLLPELYMV